MIVKQGGKYVVKSADGSKTLGTYDDEEEAKKRLAQIEFFKARDAGAIPALRRGGRAR